MRRDLFVQGLLTPRSTAKKRMMVMEYTEIIKFIEDIEEDSEYGDDWNEVRTKVLIMWNYFYDTYMPVLGGKHKGDSIIGKNLDSHAGRMQLIRVMKMQMEKFQHE